MSDVERVYIQDWRLPGCNVEMVRGSDFDAIVARLAAELAEARRSLDLRAGRQAALAVERDALRAQLDSETKLHLEHEAQHMALVIGLKDRIDALTAELAEADARGERRANAAARLTAQAWETERDALQAQVAGLREALSELLDCPMWVDDATVPKAGIEAAPEQVVFNASIALMRLRKARAALAERPSPATHSD